jgi:hypothetical protein
LPITTDKYCDIRFINGAYLVYSGGKKETYNAGHNYLPFHVSGGKCGVFDSTGKPLLPIKYDYIYQKNNYWIACVRKQETEYDYEFSSDDVSLFDLQGRKLFQQQYNGINPVGNNLFIVIKAGKYGILNEKEEIVIPFNYYSYIKSLFEWIQIYEPDLSRSFFEPDTAWELFCGSKKSKELFAVRNKNGVGIINTTTGILIIPTKYDNIIPIERGYILIEKEDSNSVQWGDPVRYKGIRGFADNTGKVIVPCKYNYVVPFSNGYYAVSNGGILDLLSQFYGDCWYYASPEEYNGGKWGLLDSAGKEILPLHYNNIVEIAKGQFEVTVGNKSKIVNSRGEDVTSWKLIRQNK